MKMKIHYWERMETFIGSGEFKDGAACGHPLASYFAKKKISEVTCQNCLNYIKAFHITRLHPATPTES